MIPVCPFRLGTFCGSMIFHQDGQARGSPASSRSELQSRRLSHRSTVGKSCLIKGSKKNSRVPGVRDIHVTAGMR